MMSEEKDGRVTLTPCDFITFPVYATYRAVRGIVAYKMMFAKSQIIVLKYVEDDGKEQLIFTGKPSVFMNGVNYYDTDLKKWVIE